MLSYIILSVISILIVFSITNNRITVLSNRVEDALVSATLGGATIDLRRYATDGKIVNIEDKHLKFSYNNFKSTLKENLNLDNDFRTKKESLIKSKINIDDFIVYSNVDGSIYRSKVTDGFINKSKMSLGSKTPNGKPIEDTTIYSKISFTINVLGKDYKVHKSTSVKVTDK